MPYKKEPTLLLGAFDRCLIKYIRVSVVVVMKITWKPHDANSWDNGGGVTAGGKSTRGGQVTHEMNMQAREFFERFHK